MHTNQHPHIQHKQHQIQHQPIIKPLYNNVSRQQPNYEITKNTVNTSGPLVNIKAISAPCSPTRTSILSSRYSRQLIMPPSQYLQNKRPSMIAQQRAEREKSLPPLSDVRANISFQSDAAITLAGMSSGLIDNNWNAPDIVSRVFSNVLPTHLFESMSTKTSSVVMPSIMENSCKKRRFSESMEDSQQPQYYQHQNLKNAKPRLSATSTSVTSTSAEFVGIPARVVTLPSSAHPTALLKPPTVSCADLLLDAERYSPGICDGNDTMNGSISGNSARRSNSPLTETSSFNQVLSRLTNRPTGSTHILTSRLRNSFENLAAGGGSGTSGGSSIDIMCESPSHIQGDDNVSNNDEIIDTKGCFAIGGVAGITFKNIQCAPVPAHSPSNINSTSNHQLQPSAGSATRSSNRSQRRLTTASFSSRCASLESLNGAVGAQHHQQQTSAAPPRPRPSYHHHLNMDAASAAALKHAGCRTGNKYLEYNEYKMAAPVPAMRSARPSHTYLPGEAGNNITRALTDTQVEDELIERKVRSMWDESEFHAMRQSIREFGRCFPIVGEVGLYDQSRDVIRHLVDVELEAEYESEKIKEGEQKEAIKEEKEMQGVVVESLSDQQGTSSSTPLPPPPPTLPTDLWRHTGIKATPDLITFYYMHKHELKWKVKPKARPAQRKKKDRVRQMLRVVHI